MASGKAPNLRNFAHLYRDPEKEQEVVWRMACMWQEHQELLVAAYPDAEERAAKQADFNRGALDSGMSDRCRAMDPGFDHKDWRHIRIQTQGAMATWAPDALSHHVSEAGWVEKLRGARELVWFNFARLRQPARRQTGTS